MTLKCNGKLMLFAFIVLLTSGCFTVGPNFIKPKYDMPNKWNTSLSTESEGKKSDLILVDWWKTFDDPVLDDLISRATQGNLDLKNAVSRIRETRASWSLSKTDLLPDVNTSANFTSSKSYADNAPSGRSKLYTIDIDANWEIDLFGSLRRSSEAAKADYESMKENYNDVLISLLSEVALNYVNVRTYQKQFASVEENLETQTEIYELTKLKFDTGILSKVDVNRAKYNLEDIRSNLSGIKQNLDTAMNHIAVLLGIKPGGVHDQLSKEKPIPKVSLNIDVGLPVDLIRRRPDIRVAERELAAQTARVGVATAELYPKFTLSGLIGFESISFSDLLSSDSLNNRFGPGLTWRIFDIHSIRKNIEVQNARQEQSLINYESTILNAIEEVENALTSYVQEQMHKQSILESIKASQNLFDLTLLRYNSGLVEYINVLDIQQTLLSYQNQLDQSNSNLAQYLIKIYKALGGGWNS
jgi:NodT family efflux transporter outer membrane factor (OMF) lipoprotein